MICGGMIVHCFRYYCCTEVTVPILAKFQSVVVHGMHRLVLVVVHGMPTCLFSLTHLPPFRRPPAAPCPTTVDLTCPSAVTGADLLASVCERYTTVKRLVVKPGLLAPASGTSVPASAERSASASAAAASPQQQQTDLDPNTPSSCVLVEIQFAGPQPSERCGALLCHLLGGDSVDARPMELPRGRKKRSTRLEDDATLVMPSASANVVLSGASMTNECVSLRVRGKQPSLVFDRAPEVGGTCRVPGLRGLCVGVGCVGVDQCVRREVVSVCVGPISWLCLGSFPQARYLYNNSMRGGCTQFVAPSFFLCRSASCTSYQRRDGQMDTNGRIVFILIVLRILYASSSDDIYFPSFSKNYYIRMYYTANCCRPVPGLAGELIGQTNNSPWPECAG